MRQLRERIERKELELHAKVLESGLQVNWFDSLVDPYEFLHDDRDFWLPLAGDAVPPTMNKTLRGELLPVYVTWYGLKNIRDMSRQLAARNEFAINAIENRCSYVVGKGFQTKVTPKDGQESPQILELCKQAQRVLDEFADANAWGEREQEAVKRCDRDGEAFLRFFHVGEGRTEVRFVEPEWVMSLTEQQDNTYGIVVEDGDVEDVVAFQVIEYPPYSQPVEVPAEEIVHIKLNSESTSKRGLPTLFAVRKNLDRADKLLRNMSTLAQVQATFALIRKHKQYSASAVSAWQQGQSDVSYTNNVSGKTNYMQQFKPGTVIDIPENMDYEFPAVHADAAGLTQILQAELRAIASRLVMPEYMLTADASNANYSSTMVAESPAVKNFERLQAFYARRFGDGCYGHPRRAGALWRVLRNAVEYGGLPREVLTLCELQVEGPSLIVRDKSQETNRAQTLNQNGILSKPTWAKWEGLDYEQEQKQIAETQQEEQQQQGQQEPPDDQGQPAELGGDGGNPFANLGGAVPEGFTGEITDTAGHHRKYVNGVQVANANDPAQQQQSASRAGSAAQGVVTVLGKAFGLGKAVSGKAKKVLFYHYDKSNEIAVNIARKAGGEEHAKRIGRFVGIANWVGYAASLAAQVGGVAMGDPAMIAAGKAASYVPIGSASYLTYSAAKNKDKIWKAARKKARLLRLHPPKTREAVEGDFGDAPGPMELAGMIAKHLVEQYNAVPDPDWYEALLYACLDETKGDVKAAIKLADEAVAEEPEPGRDVAEAKEGEKFTTAKGTIMVWAKNKHGGLTPVRAKNELPASEKPKRVANSRPDPTRFAEKDPETGKIKLRKKHPIAATEKPSAEEHKQAIQTIHTALEKTGGPLTEKEQAIAKGSAHAMQAEMEERGERVAHVNWGEWMETIGLTYRLGNELTYQIQRNTGKPKKVAEKTSHILSTCDLAIGGGLMVAGTAATIAAALGAGLPTGGLGAIPVAIVGIAGTTATASVPWASLLYANANMGSFLPGTLATGYHPIATAKAATKILGDVFDMVHGVAKHELHGITKGVRHAEAVEDDSKQLSPEQIDAVADAVQEHGGDEWFGLLVVTAFSVTQDMDQALELATEAYRKMPEPAESGK